MHYHNACVIIPISYFNHIYCVLHLSLCMHAIDVTYADVYCIIC